jgi:MtrB/PioB family decaheme-associated outer membrane protein
MTTSVFAYRAHKTVVALAVSAACVAAQAQTEGAQTTISVGLGAVTGSSADRAQFGQYNGLHTDRKVIVTTDIDYSLRKIDSPTWVQFEGSNLLGDSRELHLVWKNPGNWKLSADYGELVHYNPNTVNTGLLGGGSATPQVLPLLAGTGTDYDLKTKRTGMGLGLAKFITPALQFELDLKSEKKEGARISGIGMNCPSVIAPSCGANTGWALLMLPEPINAQHSQIDARISYALEKLRFTLGYYGSIYRNAVDTLNPSVPTSLNTNAALIALLNNPVALAPDNQAHQLDLSGSYDLTPTTRGTFKLGYATATQNADFASTGLSSAPAGVSNLGGLVNTRLAKIGLTSRPIAKLSLLADLRYDDKNDQTPIALYNTEGTSTYTNRDLSSKKSNGKLQASWQFNSDYRGTLGADYEAIDRGVYTATSAVSGINALRQNTREKGVRAELRGRMADNFSGTVGVFSSRRDGSNWLKDNSGLGVTEVSNPADPVTGFLPTAIFMPTLADRQRNKIKLFTDWQPSESLTLQISAEKGTDKFTTPSVYGLRDTGMNQFSIDWGYALSDNWALNGYASRGVQTFNQARPAGYLMAFDNTNLAASIGFTGKASSKLNVGGNLTYVGDKSVYAQTADATADAYSQTLLATSGGLPDVVYRQTALKLFGKYALEKGAAVRLDLVYQRASVNDWTWTAFSYSDGTTVTQKPTQNVGVIAVTYVYQLP